MNRLLLCTGILLSLDAVSLGWPSDVYNQLQSSVCKIIDITDTDKLKNNVDHFESNWNSTLNSARENLKEWEAPPWNDNKDCPKLGYLKSLSKSSVSDIKCLIKDLQTIGIIIHEDLKRLSYAAVSCGAYQLYLQAWHQHPVINNLKCYEQEQPSYSIFQYVYDSGITWNGPLSTWQSDPIQYATTRLKCGAIYTKAVIKGLREEIETLCISSATEKLCHLRLCMNIADAAEKLLDYTKSGVPCTDHHLHAFLLNIFASARKLDQLYPDWLENVPRKSGQQFEEAYDTDSWAKSKVVNLIDYVFESSKYIHEANSDKGLQLLSTLQLLPFNYQCENSKTFGSLCWTIGVLDGMAKTLKPINNSLHKHKKVQVNTAVDYKAFLQQTQQDRLLKLSETSDNNLIQIAKELHDDILDSLDQSLANSANQVIESVQTGFGSLRTHFQQEASFDKAIANADIAFINGEIKKYVESSMILKNRVSHLVGNILYYGLVAAAGDLAEASIKLVFHVLSMWNPFNFLTGGTSVVDTMDGLAEFEQSLANLEMARRLREAWSKMSSLSKTVAYNLAKNQAFLENVHDLVKSLSADRPPPNFEIQKEFFIQKYNKYSPAVNVEDLTEATTSWELIIDEGCELIDSTSGTTSAISKMELGDDCISAKGEVQKLTALYEEIFEFQFDMMDALTDCVRASNSFESANSITAGLDTAREVVSSDRERDVLQELKMLTGYSSMLYRASVLTAKENYCNVIEYREGRRPDVCKTLDWNLANLLSQSQTPYEFNQDFEVIPTRPSFPGDKAFIDLKDLYAGKLVRFQVPNSEWLVKRGWISTDARNKPIFVQRFEIYLPVSQASEVQVTAKASIGNHLWRSENESSTEYIINPRRPLIFSYKVGGESCRNAKIENPYGSTCRNMPDICPVTLDPLDTELQESIYPSIYAMWNIKLSGYESANLAVPVTNVGLRIGLQTGSPAISSRKKRSSKTSKTRQIYLNRSRRSTETPKCCQDDHFVNETSMCEACPPYSVSKQNGLVCECLPICENGGTVLTHYGQCSCLCDSEHYGQFCEIKRCNSGEEFTCHNTECIPLAKYCDKYNDCSDGSDEPSGCQREHDDCYDGLKCASRDIHLETRGRYAGSNTTECVANNWVCDGDYDCESFWDEASCVSEGRYKEECPQDWVGYAGACYMLAFPVNTYLYDQFTVKNESDARDFCEQSGGTLADLRKESEHWFLYSLFIGNRNDMSNPYLKDQDYVKAKKEGIDATNQKYLKDNDYSGFLWVGATSLQLTRHFGDFDDNRAFRPSAREKCRALNTTNWRYSYQDCGQTAGVICTYRSRDATTPAPTQVPNNTLNETSGEETSGDISIGKNEGLQKLEEGLQDLKKELKLMSNGTNNGLRDLKEEIQLMNNELGNGFQDMRKEMQEINHSLQILLQNIGNTDGRSDQSTANIQTAKPTQSSGSQTQSTTTAATSSSYRPRHPAHSPFFNFFK